MELAISSQITSWESNLKHFYSDNCLPLHGSRKPFKYAYGVVIKFSALSDAFHIHFSVLSLHIFLVHNFEGLLLGSENLVRRKDRVVPKIPVTTEDNNMR